jgi:hypothetical protein
MDQPLGRENMTKKKWRYVGVDWSRMEGFDARPLGERAKILSILQRAKHPLAAEEIKPFVSYTKESILRYLNSLREFGLVESTE